MGVASPSRMTTGPVDHLAGPGPAYSVPGLAIPAHFGETLQRNAEHFEALLGLLKVFAHALEEDGLADPPFSRERARRDLEGGGHPRRGPRARLRAPTHPVYALGRRAGFLFSGGPDMIHYFEQTVVQQTSPDEDMTGLDWFLFSRIFDRERDVGQQILRLAESGGQKTLVTSTRLVTLFVETALRRTVHGCSLTCRK
jgi:hypothetical protein